MVKTVKEAFKTNFKNLDWMDEETRNSAREKADAITDMIGNIPITTLITEIIHFKCYQSIILLFKLINTI